MVDGTNYQSWSAASAAVKKGGTIVLNDDVQLTEEDKLPDVACTIRSADGETKYRLSGSPMTMNADLTLYEHHLCARKSCTRTGMILTDRERCGDRVELDRLQPVCRQYRRKHRSGHAAHQRAGR